MGCTASKSNTKNAKAGSKDKKSKAPPQKSKIDASSGEEEDVINHNNVLAIKENGEQEGAPEPNNQLVPYEKDP